MNSWRDPIGLNQSPMMWKYIWYRPAARAAEFSQFGSGNNSPAVDVLE
jgi:hypothetical protein